jgi:hypothetical protein
MSEAAERWIGHFPEPWQRSLVEYWFRRGLAQSATTPAELLARVLVIIGQKRSFAVETRSIMLCEAAAQACVCNRPGGFFGESEKFWAPETLSFVTQWLVRCLENGG